MLADGAKTFGKPVEEGEEGPKYQEALMSIASDYEDEMALSDRDMDE